MENNLIIRVFKYDPRTNVLRTFISTDKGVCVTGSVIILYFSYVFYAHILHSFNFMNWLLTCAILEFILVYVVTRKIDNQSIYKLLYRQFLYYIGKRKYKMDTLDSYFTDFSIQDSLVVKKKQMSIVFEIEPVDISDYNQDDIASFYASIKQALHTLPQQIKLFIHKEPQTTNDIQEHVVSVAKSLSSTNKQRAKLADMYVDELSDVIESEEFFVTKVYGVFSITVDSYNPEGKVKTIGLLHDMYNRLRSELKNTGYDIQTRQLSDANLIAFMRKQLL